MKTNAHFLLIALLVYFVAFSGAQAVTPAPDGCYSNFTTAEGCSALDALTTGAGNTALGWFALSTDSDGSFNTAVGGGALTLNNGDSNTAVGAAALLLNTAGMENTAIGTDAMVFNDTGSSNTAVGAFALSSNIDGYNNNAFGYHSLGAQQSGTSNNAFGYYALGVNNGTGNNALGTLALEFNTGSYNTAVGDGALDISTGSSNIALGAGAGAFQQTGSNNIYIGDAGFFDESNVIAIGRTPPNATPYENTYIGGISGVPVPTGVAVVVDSSGHLGTTTSSARFKEAIKPMDKASEAILSLQPVTFRYKKDLDPKATPQFGLVAEQVEKVNPDLVARDEQGKPYTVRYEAVNAMLLNEFLKEHHKNEKQEATIARLQKQVEALTAGLHKVSDQLEAGKLEQQVVAKSTGR